MPRQVDSLFSKYEFPSTAEYNSAHIFTEAQKQAIQTQIACIAEEKVSMAYDPAEPEKFRLTHEYLRGQIEILTYILLCSDQCKNDSGKE